MQIRIISEYFRIEAGVLGFFSPSLHQHVGTLSPISNEADSALLLWAECVSPNLLETDINREGSYEIIFGNRRLTHLPSGHSSQALSIKHTRVVVTSENIASDEMIVVISNEALYEIVLFRNGVCEPNARALLAQDFNTVEARTDESGAITLLDDPRELIALAFDGKLKASLFCWDRSGRKTLLASTDAFPSPLQS